MMQTAEQTRELAGQRLKALVADPNTDLPSVISLLMALNNTIMTATWLGNTEAVAHWEEQNGDLIASMPVGIQAQIPDGFRADDSYFGAAEAWLELDPGNIAEAERLLTKIDALKVKRKGSSFHATILADNLSYNSSPRAAYDFALRWFLSHADEPDSGSLLNRVAALGTSYLSTNNHDANASMRQQLKDLETRYADVVRRHDRQRADELRAANAGLEQPRPIANWEQHIIASQFLWDQVIYAEMNNDPDLADLASRFVTMYPQHPSVEAANQILRQKADSGR
ncbi:MAG TPA: hypothetical protein ENJ00_04685 [Phycisphaerales bacterium]|nr:hypothetical protein [Phycisphaerales bacterium]